MELLLLGQLLMYDACGMYQGQLVQKSDSIVRYDKYGKYEGIAQISGNNGVIIAPSNEFKGLESPCMNDCLLDNTGFSDKY